METRTTNNHRDIRQNSVDDPPDNSCEYASSMVTDSSILNSTKRNENTIKPVLGAYPTFQTEGKNVNIHLSEKESSEAKDLLSEAVVGISTCQQPLHGRLNYAADEPCRDDSSTLPSEASLNSFQPTCDKLLDNANLTNASTGPFPVFQTAGKNLPIQVSAESLANAQTLLSLENIDAQKSNDAPGTDSKYTNRMTYTTHRPVINPYRNHKPNSYTPSKSTINQVSQSANNNSNTISAKSSMATESTKQVHNPYTKTTSNFSTLRERNGVTASACQTLVKNPYISTKSGPIEPSKTTTPLSSHSRGAEMSVSTAKSINSSTTISSHRSSSRFFLMADRLPSRNVSYQPAEILTVGELYRYLYSKHDDNDNSTKDGQNLDSDDTTKVVYRKLKSVRITGILLCTSYSDVDGSERGLYGGGQWLLIGDPVERTRFAKVQEQTVKSYSDHGRRARDYSGTIGAISATPKSNVTMEKSDTSDKPTSSTTPLQNDVSSSLNSNKVMSAGRSGGLTSDKKRKLVCTKNYGRNSLSSSKGIVRKFQTPKRMDSASSYAKNGTANGGALFSSSKNVATQSYVGVASATNGNSHRPSHIIRHHPSPIVPVWNGSTPDCNGLDGSVAGDLVMILGDIVVESCDSCKNLAGSLEEEEAAPKSNEDLEVEEFAINRPSDNIPILDVRDAARFIASCTSNREGFNAKKNCHCTLFLQARFVKNVNGTDMNLQNEALRVRREYIKKRMKDMALLLPGNSDQFAIGSGPYL